MKQTIGVVGHGYVGKAIDNMFKDHYNIKIYDPQYIKSGSMIGEDKCINLSDLDFVDLLVVCVPTETNEDGSCDISIVESTLKGTKAKTILIKSTIPPYTTAKLNKKYGTKAVFSPEYAGESKYWTPYAFHTDMKAMPYTILGGDKKECEKISNFIVRVGGPTRDIYYTDSQTAELVKYWENMYYAAKVTFMQEMYEVCQALDINYNEARTLWLADPRINKMHTAVFPEERGFGGKCFVKDTKAIVKFSTDAGYFPPLLNGVVEMNKKFRKMNV